MISKIKCLILWRFILLFVLLISINSCTTPDESYAFLIDNSKSMLSGNVIDKVKELFALKIKEVSNSKNHIIIYKFDSEVKEIYRGSPSNENIDAIIELVDGINPDGNWTYIAEALTHAFQELETTDSKIKKIIMLTDGLNDPPPGINVTDMQAALFDTVQAISDKLREDGGYLYIVNCSNEEVTVEHDGDNKFIFSPKEFLNTPLVKASGVLLAFIIVIVVIIAVGGIIQRKLCTFPKYALIHLDEEQKVSLNKYKLNMYRKWCKEAICIPGDIEITNIDNNFYIITKRNGKLYIFPEGNEVIVSGMTLTPDEKYEIHENDVFSCSGEFFRIESIIK